MLVLDYLNSRLKKGTVHITLIDPAKQQPEIASRLAIIAQEVGSDLILVGGSSGINQKNLSDTAAAVQAVVDIPVVYFPAGAEALSLDFDALFFLSMLNSGNTKFITGTQSRAALILKRLEIETIPVGYIVVEPGMKVGEVGEAELIPRDNFWLAASYAVTSEMMGMKFVYLEAGSGAHQPVSAGMIRAVKREISIPLIVGGGIRAAVDARRVRHAGADIVVTGTIIESAGYKDKLKAILSALKD